MYEEFGCHVSKMSRVNVMKQLLWGRSWFDYADLSPARPFISSLYPLSGLFLPCLRYIGAPFNQPFPPSILTFYLVCVALISVFVISFFLSHHLLWSVKVIHTIAVFIDLFLKLFSNDFINFHVLYTYVTCISVIHFTLSINLLGVMFY